MTTPTHVLVVDDSAVIRRMVSNELGKLGFTISTAADGLEGLKLAGEQPPNLVISDVVMPRMDGWTFVRLLRARSATAITPVIFLTSLNSDEDRMRGFGLGADDYLPKPFNAEELAVRVKNALKKGTQIQNQAKQTVASKMGIQGVLDQIGLAALLRILEMGKKSGILQVNHKQETARLFLREGQVVRAIHDGRADLRGTDCVYYILGWADGRFNFTALDVDLEDEIKMGTKQLLEQGAKVLSQGNK